MIFSGRYRPFLLSLLLLFPGALSAQFYSVGTEPASMKWRVIKTDNFKILFSEGCDSLANLFAMRMERDRPLISGDSGGVAKRRFPVILHSNNVYYNGVVVWAPKRVELFTTPPAFGGYPQSWAGQLSLHEQRHINQMRSLDVGAFKVLGKIIGEQATGVAAGLYTSKWELEGDAVISETNFSSSGRGRDPEFLMHYRASALSGERGNYARWSMGSTDRYEPDHYSFGYMFLSEVEREFGVDALSRAIKYRVTHPLDLDGSNSSYRLITGFKNKRELFKHLQGNLIKRWRTYDSASAPYTKFTPIGKRSHEYEKSLPSALLNDTTLIIVSQDLDRLGRVETLTLSGKRRVISNTDGINSRVTSRDGVLYWSESVPSPRWEQLSYSRIVRYDTRTGKRRFITSRSRYFNPTPIDNEHLAVVHYSLSGHSNIQIISSIGGFIEKSCGTKMFVAQIKELCIKDSVIFYTAVEDEWVTLNLCTLDGEKIKSFRAKKGRDINNIRVEGDYVYFGSNDGNRCNIYSLNYLTGKVARVTNSRFGAFSPLRIGRDSIIYSEYDKSGYFPVIAQIEEDQVEGLIAENNAIMDSQEEFHAKYKSEKYSRFDGIFNIHSWAPLYYNADELLTSSFEVNDMPVKPGFVVMSQNLTGTLTASAGMSYENGRGAGHLNLTYRELFPVIELSVDANERSFIKYYMAASSSMANPLIYSTSTSPMVSSRLRLYVPFNLSRWGRVRGFTPMIQWRYRNDRFFEEGGRWMSFNLITASVQYYDVKSMAKRNIFPNNGFGLSAKYSFFPGRSSYFAPMAYLGGYIYLPGVNRLQGCRIDLSYQRQFADEKFFYQENQRTFVRGYNSFYSSSIFAAGLTYTIPIYVRQNALQHILYIKRIRVNPFFDFAGYDNRGAKSSIYSYGTELLADFNLFGIMFPVTGGTRIINSKDGKLGAEFVFNLSL